MMKFKAAFLACSLACGSVMADSGLPNPATNGQPVVINGQSFHKVVPKNGTTLFFARQAPDKGVYAGDKLMDPAGIKDYTATGTIFIRISGNDARQLANKHGLKIILSTDSITSFQTKEGTELTGLMNRLKEEGRQAQLELANETASPM